MTKEKEKKVKKHSEKGSVLGIKSQHKLQFWWGRLSKSHT